MSENKKEKESPLSYFKNDILAENIWKSKYGISDDHPHDTHRRIAKEFLRIENSYNDNYYEGLSDYGKKRPRWTEEKIFNWLNNFEIVPGGSIISSMGHNSPISISNCFVIPPPKDNIESIMNSARDMSQIYKRRGGVGIDISNLRPNNSSVNNSAKTSTGPVSFMPLYSKITEVVAQQGRRGALMISIDGRHPDIEEFISCKQGDNSAITGANISIKLHDDFIEAVKNDEDYILRWPTETKILSDYVNSNKYELHNFEYNKLIYINNSFCTGYIKKVKARYIWNKIIKAVHSSAEPGIFNWDLMTDYDPTSVYRELRPVSTNPCGELGLSGFDSCRLIATNLYKFVKNPFAKNSSVDWNEVYERFYEAQCLADIIVDLELEAVDRILKKIEPTYEFWSYYNNPALIKGRCDEFKLWWKIRDIGSSGRRTGAGIMGYADFLAALNLNYGDSEITEKLFKIKLQAELDASIDLAIQGGPFYLYDKEKESKNSNKWYKFIYDNFPEQWDRMSKYGRRNAGLSTVAPTGSISIIARCSSGIEPVFMPFYKRRKRITDGEKAHFTDENGVGYIEYIVVHPGLIKFYNQNCIELFPGWDNYDTDSFTEETWSNIYKMSPYYRNIASDIDPEFRVKTQALIQKFITSSISSTVNLDENATIDDVDIIYKNVFKYGCKGITSYREGSRSGVLVSASKKGEVHPNGVIKRPRILDADYYLVTAKGIKYVVIIGLFNNKPYEIFVFEAQDENGIKIPKETHRGKVTKVKKGRYSFDSPLINIEDLQIANDKIEEKACTLYASMLLRHGADIQHVIKTSKKVDDNISSFASAMCRVLSRYDQVKELTDVCPECGGKLIHESGCIHCKDCEYSKCN